jgi:DNA-binding transcriptional LysR family regulator
MQISLDALQILDAIDARGSFAAAAEALHRVPSALTHAVRKLEDDLAVTLFVRQGRRAVLTPAGRLLLEEGRHLLSAAGELECRVKRIATGWEHELRIAVEAVLDVNALWPLVGDFYKELSGTRLRLATEVLGGCWDALATAAPTWPSARPATCRRAAATARACSAARSRCSPWRRRIRWPRCASRCPRRKSSSTAPW